MLDDLQEEIPKEHEQITDNPFGGGVSRQIECKDDKKRLCNLLWNQTWRLQMNMSVTGIEGAPDLKGGNGLRKYTTFKLSIHTPPSINPKRAAEIVTNKLIAKPYHLIQMLNLIVVDIWRMDLSVLK